MAGSGSWAWPPRRVVVLAGRTVEGAVAVAPRAVVVSPLWLVLEYLGGTLGAVPLYAAIEERLRWKEIQSHMIRRRVGKNAIKLLSNLHDDLEKLLILSATGASLPRCGGITGVFSRPGPYSTSSQPHVQSTEVPVQIRGRDDAGITQGPEKQPSSSKPVPQLLTSQPAALRGKACLLGNSRWRCPWHSPKYKHDH